MNNPPFLSRNDQDTVLDLVCLSHLRWDFVYQRPQHLMSRFAANQRVFFVEEPIYHEGRDMIKIRITESNVNVVVPMLNNSNPATTGTLIDRQRKLINHLMKQKKIKNFIAWYYTPMALKITDHLTPDLIVYDCMDELSAFKFAPQELQMREAELFNKAAVVFTGGNTLYESKKRYHKNIYSFPSSIDKSHFAKARTFLEAPSDQSPIPGPRFGFHGVLDERFNIKLIAEVAEKEKEWNFVFVGPVVKIDPKDLPKGPNIRYLGGKTYEELPSYLAGWDVALVPFEKNESTKFISPTKTPEYLAAGKPVISSSIADVVNPYGEKGLVHIADDADTFIAAAKMELSKSGIQKEKWLKQVDAFLQPISWEETFKGMNAKIQDCLAAQQKTVSNLKSVA